MPRGLGDNPLKEKKRARRTGTRTPHTAVGSESPVDSPAVSGQESVQASSSSSRSYNDVFFQRLPENPGVAANSAPEEIRPDESSAAAPIAGSTAVDAQSIPEVAASAVLEQAPFEAIPAATAPATFTSPEPSPAVEIAPEPALSSLAVAIAQPAPSPGTAPQQEAKTGFFSRIFGRRHK